MNRVVLLSAVQGFKQKRLKCHVKNSTISIAIDHQGTPSLKNLQLQEDKLMPLLTSFKFWKGVKFVIDKAVFCAPPVASLHEHPRLY